MSVLDRAIVKAYERRRLSATVEPAADNLRRTTDIEATLAVAASLTDASAHTDVVEPEAAVVRSANSSASKTEVDTNFQEAASFSDLSREEPADAAQPFPATPAESSTKEFSDAGNVADAAQVTNHIADDQESYQTSSPTVPASPMVSADRGLNAESVETDDVVAVLNRPIPDIDISAGALAADPVAPADPIAALAASPDPGPLAETTSSPAAESSSGLLSAASSAPPPIPFASVQDASPRSETQATVAADHGDADHGAADRVSAVQPVTDRIVTEDAAATVFAGRNRPVSTVETRFITKPAAVSARTTGSPLAAPVEPTAWKWPEICEQLDQFTGDGFRQLARHLQTAAEQGHKVLAFVSSKPGVGRTSVLLTLARILSLDGRSDVLLIDADRRRPDLARQTGLIAPTGLSEVLHGQATATQAIVRRSSGNISILPLLKPVSETEWQSVTTQLRSLVKQVRNDHDMVLIDAGVFGPETRMPDCWLRGSADAVITISRQLSGKNTAHEVLNWKQIGIESLGVIETFS